MLIDIDKEIRYDALIEYLLDEKLIESKEIYSYSSKEFDKILENEFKERECYILKNINEKAKDLAKKFNISLGRFYEIKNKSARKFNDWLLPSKGFLVKSNEIISYEYFKEKMQKMKEEKAIEIKERKELAKRYNRCRRQNISLLSIIERGFWCLGSVRGENDKYAEAKVILFEQINENFKIRKKQNKTL